MMKPQNRYLVTLLTAFLLPAMSGPTSAQLEIIVPEGLDDVEGSSGIGLATVPHRSQELFLASDFESLPEGGAHFIAFLDRTDADQPNAVTVNYHHLRLTLSVTQTDSLSADFSENVGLNPVTVLNGQFQATYNVDGESPGPFSTTYEFDSPFFYDPKQGNLLLDFVSQSGASERVRIDAEQYDATRINYIPDPESPSAQFLWGQAPVHKFLFLPAYAGDFDHNRVLDFADVDALSVAVDDGSTDLVFDVNMDKAIDDDDLNFWVENLKQTWFGDANLDGEFNSADFVQVFQAGEYEDDKEKNSTWAEGDWNADREFDSGDFVKAFQGGGFEQGPRADTAAVPEPACPLSLSIGTGVIMFLRRKKWRSC